MYKQVTINAIFLPASVTQIKMNNDLPFNQKSKPFNKTSKKLKNWDKISRKQERDGERKERNIHTKDSSDPSSKEKTLDFQYYEKLSHLNKAFDQSHFATMQMSSFTSSIIEKNRKNDPIPKMLKESLKSKFKDMTAEEMLESNFVNYLHLFDEQLKNTDNKCSIQAVKEEMERSIKVILNSLTDYSAFEELENSVNETISKYDLNI